jgi:hypothetical protein
VEGSGSSESSLNLAVFFTVNLHNLVVTRVAILVKVILIFAGYFDAFSYPFITFKYLSSALVGLEIGKEKLEIDLLLIDRELLFLAILDRLLRCMSVGEELVFLKAHRGELSPAVLRQLKRGILAKKRRREAEASAKASPVGTNLTLPEEDCAVPEGSPSRHGQAQSQGVGFVRF